MSATPAAGPRLLPVVMVGLALFGLAKAADLWIGFSTAGAEEVQAAVPPTPLAAIKPAAAADTGTEPIDLHLADRRAELDAREEALETRQALLDATEARIEARLAELDAREQETLALEAARKNEEAAQLRKLSAAYERMKPRDAARIFEALDADLLGPVAGGMRTQSLAAVLGEMEAGKAKALTELLARRRAAPGASAP